MADSYEDFEPYFPEDDFADKYADELEMLREWDDLDVPPRRGRQLFPPPPPPNWDRVARSDTELQDASLPLKEAQHIDGANEGEVVSQLFMCTTLVRAVFRRGWVSLEL